MNVNKSTQTTSFLLSRNFFKVFALFSSFALWFYVLNSEPLEMEKEVPLAFVAPTGQTIANIVTPTLKVKVRGSRAFMQNLFKNDEKVYVDLRDPAYENRQEFDVHLTPANIPVPFGVEVLEVNPHQVPVVLDRLIRKEVPIRPQFVGELSNDLRLIRQDLEPNKVMISGPVEVMRKTTHLRTNAVQLNSLEGEGDLRLRLHEVDPRISVELEQPLHFFYSIKAQTANLTVRNVKIRFLTSRQDFSSRQREASLDVLAPEGRTLRESEVQILADIPEDAKGNINIKLRAVLPEGVHLLQIHPETINVRVR